LHLELETAFRAARINEILPHVNRFIYLPLWMRNSTSCFSRAPGHFKGSPGWFPLALADHFINTPSKLARILSRKVAWIGFPLRASSDHLFIVGALRARRTVCVIVPLSSCCVGHWRQTNWWIRWIDHECGLSDRVVCTM